jgi:hypothetical protein
MGFTLTLIKFKIRKNTFHQMTWKRDLSETQTFLMFAAGNHQ